MLEFSIGLVVNCESIALEVVSLVAAIHLLLELVVIEMSFIVGGLLASPDGALLTRSSSLGSHIQIKHVVQVVFLSSLLSTDHVKLILGLQSALFIVRCGVHLNESIRLVLRRSSSLVGWIVTCVHV